MPPARSKKRSSDDIDQSTTMQKQTIPTKTGTPTMLSSSPSKRQRLGITLEQKQAIIDNLQLEITDRARRLRAQYNQQAQTLRSRIQMRVNRVPRSMLKMTMADLVARAAEQQKRLEASSRPPPVPEKDFPPRPSPQRLALPARSTKRLSDAMTGGDKENERIVNPKKKHRAGPSATALSSSQILSPTSSNTRSLIRDRPLSSPSKSHVGRPPSSPVKQHNSARSALSNMVEKAKKTSRPAAQRALASSTNSSNASAPVNASAPAITRTKRANTTTAAKAPSRPATRTGKRVSDSSEGSTGTVVKKTAAAAPTTTKRTVMGAIRKGVGAATARKPAAPKSAPASTAGSTRVLRKRA
ncbi:Borealin-lik [Colletotrichum asianum]